jgi:NAD(P)-dependent dehydrogenase (short-subunit alcohol dehydrogenase family)
MATVLITGANKGIGLELSRQLSERGDQVFALCRTASPELRALGVRLFEKADVTDPEALRAVSRDLGDTQIDVLINNAGIFTQESFPDLDYNHLALGSKIILITSRMGSIDDNGSGGYYGYRMSKAALNMAGVNLAHDFRHKGIAVATLHPGMVATQMTGHHGISTAESAEGLIARIDELRLEDSGGFWHANGDRLPW